MHLKRFAHQRRVIRAGVGLAALTVILGSAEPARADAAAAEALFREAKQLMEGQRFTEACAKFQASYDLDRTLGTLLNVANCREKEGAIATAWAKWGESVELAQKLRDDRAEYAVDRRDDLLDRLPYLTVTVDNSAPGLTVRRDEVEVLAATYGVALPVDPGQHVVTVVRGDQVLKQEVVTLGEKQKATISLDLARIDAETPSEAPPPAPPPVVRLASPTAPAADNTGDTQRLVGFVVGGVGLGAVVAAAIFGGIALSEKGAADASDACVGDETKFCTPAGLASRDSAETFANLTQWVGIGGLVFVAVGATLVLTAPSDAALDERADHPGESGPTVAASPWMSADGAGLGLSGRF